MISMEHKIRNGICVGLLYVLGLLFMVYTSPQRLPIALLILPFVYMFILVFCTVLYLTSLLGYKGRARLLATTVSIFVVLLFVLGSMHQLDAKDVLLSVIITVVLSWYIVKIRR